MKRALAIFFIVIGAIGTFWFAANPARLPTFSEVRSRWRPSDVQLLDRNDEPINELRIDRHGRRLAWTAYKEISPALLRELRQALLAIRYGAIELVIHDGRVVQLERREKVRFDTEFTSHRR